ncbi:hypothetical protein WJ542_09505 [Paraburkholderia sp. B3]|uniref:hypothetical protein n=1 Tax=Paraburkholderia sp. B3 TaxID=3134791 RepID=UPI003982C77F
MRFAGPEPLVLAAEVPRREIVLYTDARDEAEAVLMHPSAASVDGAPEEWLSRYGVVKAANQDFSASNPSGVD